MKTTFYHFLSIGLLAALFLGLPLSARGQKTEQAFLYVEKIDGEIVKVPVTDDSPNFAWNQDEDSNMLLIIQPKGSQDIALRASQIKQMYTKIELVDAIQAVVDPAANGVYTLSGLYLGKHRSADVLPKGVYMIKQGTKTTKFVKR